MTMPGRLRYILPVLFLLLMTSPLHAQDFSADALLPDSASGDADDNGLPAPADKRPAVGGAAPAEIAADGFSAISRGHGLSLHKDNYIMPATWSADYHGDATEVIFQFSIKQRMFINNLYMGYTQRSFWEAYNHDISAPFRETNYNPEIFYRWLPGDDMFQRWHLDRWGFDAGVEHESNGRTVPESRSINRIYFAPFRQSRGGRDLLYLKAWYRISEPEKNDPLDPGGDDNPDYYRYFGWTQADYLHYFDNQWQLHTLIRSNLSTGRGAIELRLSAPSTGRSYFWMFNLFTGYGESLIDYNNEITRLGFGIMFSR